MKYRIITGWMACLVFMIVNAHAQSASFVAEGMNSQTFLFGQLPQKSPCDLESLEKLFLAPGKVSALVAPGIFLQGEVIARNHPNASVQSIIIKLSDFTGAICTISKIRLEDGSLRYNGHLISPDYSDAIILSRGNGKYYFVKTERRFVVTD